MFQFLRRVSGSFLPRPDRPWRDDATSHAPTIGRKRKHSVTERDGDRYASSVPKRTKTDPVKPDAESDAASGVENPKGDAVPPVEGQDVKEVTKGVKEVDLEDRDQTPIRPEVVPLPDSPSGSPEPESESQAPEPAASDEDEDEEAKDTDDKDSVASSSPEYRAGETAETEPVTTNADTTADEILPAPVVNPTIEPTLLDIPDIVEVKA